MEVHVESGDGSVLSMREATASGNVNAGTLLGLSPRCSIGFLGCSGGGERETPQLNQ